MSSTDKKTRGRPRKHQTEAESKDARKEYMKNYMQGYRKDYSKYYDKLHKENSELRMKVEELEGVIASNGNKTNNVGEKTRKFMIFLKIKDVALHKLLNKNRKVYERLMYYIFQWNN